MNTNKLKRYIYNLRSNVALGIAYVAMLMLVEMMQLNTLRWWDPLVATAFNLVFYCSMVWLLMFFAAIIGGRASKVVHAMAHIVTGIYAISSLFLMVFFHRHWDAFSMQFLHETNGTEASEFVKAYIFSWKSLAIAIASALFFLGEWWMYRHIGSTRLVPKHNFARWTLAVIVVLSAGNVFFFSTDSDRNYELTAHFKTPIKRNAIWTLWQSVLQYDEFRDEFEKCATTMSSYTEHPSCREQDADLVIIIGESFCKHMSNLYDGKYNTNPLLLRRLRDGGLYLFKDVIASDNGTTQNFKYFMSTTSVNEKAKWCDKPLFPAILRKCGYRSIYYSNQFVANDNLGQWDASMGFINHPGIEPYIIDWHNTQKFSYDLQLVDDYAKHRHEAEVKNRNLYIFHLYGQHSMSAQRYPHNMQPFSMQDVSNTYAVGNGKPLSDTQRQDIADYLNATAYNDLVVDSIIRLFDNRNAIIVYFSDHGEEIHYFRQQCGRTDLAKDVPMALRVQLDVPFMVYATPLYRKLHPETCRSLARATSQRFMTDDLPHLLFDLLGVRSKFFCPQRSPINKKYVAPLHRRLQNGRLYD